MGADAVPRLREVEGEQEVTKRPVHLWPPLEKFSDGCCPSSSDRCWSLPTEVPEGWDAGEVELSVPTSENGIAALLHGERHEYFVYACVLGHRLRAASASHGPDRVLLCGPGFCSNPAARRTLRHAGWDFLLPVTPISAEHLDKTRAKRHALVFTKLRVLELPYSRVLLLDLDLLPRHGADVGHLFDLCAPAAKYHCAEYPGASLDHGEEIPLWLREGYQWSPNAGVMRLDPLPTLSERRAQVNAMMNEIAQRDKETYLPEQYYLAERLTGWRHIDQNWNWEVWPEWDDTGITHPVPLACRKAKLAGWAGYYTGRESDDLPDAEGVLRNVRIWHFSGSWDTAPWMYLDLPDAASVRQAISKRFSARDPAGIVASAHFEWRSALDELLTEPCEDLSFLHNAVAALAARAVQALADAWACDYCGVPCRRVRKVWDVPWSGEYCSGNWSKMDWTCAECIVAQLREMDFRDCACSRSEATEESWQWMEIDSMQMYPPPSYPA